MNAQTKIQVSGLEKLREPFASNHISKKPAPTKAQNDAVKSDYRKGIRCPDCGGWHHPDVVHLDYVGHAALTDRLLDVDLEWDWEPLAYNAKGLPEIDASGGLWIRLTVLGKSRIGYGSADGKQGGNAIKELIGDALRNAAMRFGAALDLWHKGDLHGDESPEQGADGQSEQGPDMPDAEFSRLVQLQQASGVSTNSLCKEYGVRDLRQLDQGQYANAIERLTNVIANKAKEETNRAGRSDGNSNNDTRRGGRNEGGRGGSEFGDIDDSDVPF